MLEFRCAATRHCLVCAGPARMMCLITCIAPGTIVSGLSVHIAPLLLAFPSHACKEYLEMLDKYLGLHCFCKIYTDKCDALFTLFVCKVCTGKCDALTHPLRILIQKYQESGQTILVFVRIRAAERVHLLTCPRSSRQHGVHDTLYAQTRPQLQQIAKSI